MRRRFTTTVVGVLLLTGCASGGSRGVQNQETADGPAAIADSMPAEVAAVRTAGWWSAGGREGPYRIVITEHGFDKIVSRVYVQWLERPDEQSPARVLQTQGFEQINDVPLYQLEIASVRGRPNGLEVELEGFSLYTGERRRFVVRAGAPGTASLEAS